MTHFVVVYDRVTGVARITPFEGEGASEAAVSARLEAEAHARPDEEVTTLTAASEVDLRATHARYFQGPSEMFDDLERLIAG